MKALKNCELLSIELKEVLYIYKYIPITSIKFYYYYFYCVFFMTYFF